MTKHQGLKVMILGGGILEHALAKKLSESPKIAKIYAVPGNIGIAQLATCVNINENDPVQLIKFAKNEKIDLTFVGPYRLMAEGIAEHFHDANLKIFSPRAKDAEIGASRLVAKELMEHYSIPTPHYRILQSVDGALSYCEHARFPLVIKIEGTALGGTSVCHSMEDVQHYLDKTMKEKYFGEAGERVIIENFEPGEVISTTLLIDRQTIIPFPNCQIIREFVNDNKVPIRLGAFSPAACVTNKVAHQINRQILVPLVHALSRQSSHFKHFLTVDMVLTSKGPLVLDFKIQWSDILAQLLLTQFQGDFLDLIMAVLNGKPEEVKWSWQEKPSIGIVLMKDPAHTRPHLSLPDFSEKSLPENLEVFYGKSKQIKDKTYATADKILGITAVGDTFEQARKSIDDFANQLNLESVFFKNLPAGKVKKS